MLRAVGTEIMTFFKVQAGCALSSLELRFITVLPAKLSSLFPWQQLRVSQNLRGVSWHFPGEEQLELFSKPISLAPT